MMYTQTLNGAVLVVDDDESSREILTRRLRYAGLRVTAAEDGPTALNLVARKPFDAVILDVMMPGMSGLEVLAEIRESFSATDLPVIMATALDGTEEVVQALSLGANDYVAKPLDLTVVLARLQTQMSLRESVRSLSLANHRLEHAHHRMERDLEAAARVQSSLLPPENPHFGKARFGWIYRPCATVGGDSLNVFPIDENHVGFYICDVSGHGVQASLLSVALNHLLVPELAERRQSGVGSLAPQADAAGADRARKPRKVAEKLNRQFPFDPAVGQFFSLVYAVLDIHGGAMEYVSAGHPCPIMLSQHRKPEVLPGGDPLIGVFDSTERNIFKQHCARLQAGDRIVIYSDGITEASNARGELFGQQRLMESLDQSCGEPLDSCIASLERTLSDWCGGDAPEDDVSLLALEFADTTYG